MRWTRRELRGQEIVGSCSWWRTARQECRVERKKPSLERSRLEVEVELEREIWETLRSRWPE